MHGRWVQVKPTNLDMILVYLPHRAGSMAWWLFGSCALARRFFCSGIPRGMGFFSFESFVVYFPAGVTLFLFYLLILHIILLNVHVFCLYLIR
jgi:hypothetical protein